jgi:ketosteroid isomerase-like protein
MSNEQGVLQAAAHLVSRFAAHDFEGYFSCFDLNAVFIFHTSPNVLVSKAEYQKEWQKWENEWGFKVKSCSSTNQRVQMFGELAIFSHDVATTLGTNDGQNSFKERETIVFNFVANKWVAVHEHLSPMPA